MSTDWLDNLPRFDHLHDEDAPLKVGLRPFGQFSRWIDEELADLVARWAHTAAPNASRSVPRLGGHVKAQP